MKSFKKLLIISTLICLSSCSSFDLSKQLISQEHNHTNQDCFLKNTWKFVLNNRHEKDVYSFLRPAYKDNIIFAANRFGIIKAINLEDGKEKWSTDLSNKRTISLFNSKYFSKIISFLHCAKFDHFEIRESGLFSDGIAVNGNYIYIGTEHKQLYALNANDGSVVWKTTLVGEAMSFPVISNGLVFIHTGNGVLQAINQNTGKVVWNVQLELPIISMRGESSVAIKSGKVVVGSDKGSVKAFDINNGKLLWEHNIAMKVSGTNLIHYLRDVDSTPIIIGNRVYSVAYNGHLTALNLLTGAVIWQRNIGSIHDFAVNNECIYVVDQHNTVWSIMKDNGKIMWSQNKLLHHLTSPIIYKKFLVVADDRGYLSFLNIANGSIIYQKYIDGYGFVSNLLVTKDKLIVQSKYARIYSFIAG